MEDIELVVSIIGTSIPIIFAFVFEDEQVKCKDCGYKWKPDSKEK